MLALHVEKSMPGQTKRINCKSTRSRFEENLLRLEAGCASAGDTKEFVNI